MLLRRFKTKLILLLLLLFNTIVAYAQNNTLGLLNKWQKTRLTNSYLNDTANVTQLNHIAVEYLYQKADSSLYYAKLALALASHQNNQLGQAVALTNTSMAYYVLGEYSSSLEASNKLINLSSKINYKSGIGSAHQITGLVFMVQNEFNYAKNEFAIATRLFIPLKNYSKLDRLYYDLGLCYDEGATLSKTYKLNDSTFFYLNKAITIAKSIGDTHVVVMTLNRLGQTYYHLKDYNRAIGFYTSVLNSTYHDNWESGFAYSGLAESYFGLGNYHPAIANALKSLNFAKAIGTPADEANTLHVLADSYAALKDYGRAYNYSVLYKNLSDSVMNDAKETEINNLHFKGQQSDNIRLENELAVNQQKITLTRILVAIVSLFALFAIAVVIIISRNNLHKTVLNKELEARNLAIDQQKKELGYLNQTKNQLFSIISHDLRSPFSSMLQTVDLIRSGDINLEEQHTMLDNFHHQLSLIISMVNNLLVWANTQQSGIKKDIVKLDVVNTVTGVIAVSKFLAVNKNINLLQESDNEKYAYADPDHLKIILQNIIGNAIKFTSEGGLVRIFYSEDEVYLAIHIKDTGSGIPAEKMEKLFKVIGKEISNYGTNKETGAGIGLMLNNCFYLIQFAIQRKLIACF